jgi:hypothetical protein
VFTPLSLTFLLNDHFLHPSAAAQQVMIKFPACFALPIDLEFTGTRDAKNQVWQIGMSLVDTQHHRNVILETYTSKPYRLEEDAIWDKDTKEWAMDSKGGDLKEIVELLEFSRPSKLAELKETNFPKYQEVMTKTISLEEGVLEFQAKIDEWYNRMCHMEMQRPFLLSDYARDSNTDRQQPLARWLSDTNGVDLWKVCDLLNKFKLKPLLFSFSPSGSKDVYRDFVSLKEFEAAAAIKTRCHFEKKKKKTDGVDGQHPDFPKNARAHDAGQDSIFIAKKMFFYLGIVNGIIPSCTIRPAQRSRWQSFRSKLPDDSAFYCTAFVIGVSLIGASLPAIFGSVTSGTSDSGGCEIKPTVRTLKAYVPRSPLPKYCGWLTHT